MLAATARLATSAISATCSPERTPKHVSTALRAPGIRSACGEPNFIQIILLELAGFSSLSSREVFFSQLAFRPVPRMPLCPSAAVPRIQANYLYDQLAGELRGETRN